MAQRVAEAANCNYCAQFVCELLPGRCLMRLKPSRWEVLSHGPGPGQKLREAINRAASTSPAQPSDLPRRWSLTSSPAIRCRGSLKNLPRHGRPSTSYCGLRRTRRAHQKQWSGTGRLGDWLDWHTGQARPCSPCWNSQGAHGSLRGSIRSRMRAVCEMQTCARLEKPGCGTIGLRREPPTRPPSPKVPRREWARLPEPPTLMGQVSLYTVMYLHT